MQTHILRRSVRRYALSDVGNLPSQPPGLIGWWLLNESSGTVAHDSSGFGNNGTLTNTTGLVWANPGLTFNTTGANNNYVQLLGGINQVFLENQTFSFSCWASHSSSGFSSQGLLGGFTTNSGPEIYVSGTSGTVGFNKQAITVMGTSTGSIAAGVLGFVVVTYNSATGAIAFYTNGASSGTATSSQTFSYSTGGSILCLGMGFHSGSDLEALTGTMRDARIYAGILTAAQVAAMYALGPHS